jgi:acyl-homoserine-lactone acylase
MRKSVPLSAVVAIALLGDATPARRREAMSPNSELWRQVEVIRTAHGVPHIRAETLRAAGYALAWVQLEDYGRNTAMAVLRGSGRQATVQGYDSLNTDFIYRRARMRTIQSYHLLDQETRDIYDGFAAGVNRYVALHPDEFPAHMPTDFSGYDVATLDVGRPGANAGQAFLARLKGAATTDGAQPEGDPGNEADSEDGSNAWALAPSRTKSGKAILLRNPHLAWTAGYYEAQVTVPGVIDFYGDFRIGGPFGVIAGFNRYLGWATTNNAHDLDEIYALDADPATENHYLFDGASLPLMRETVTAEFRKGDELASETREFWSTPLGQVIHRADGKIYIVKGAGEGDYRAGEQFLRMMRARSLSEWKEAMRMRARTTSNFTYADRAGNIFYIWNAALPLLPHLTGGDTTATPAREMRDIWTRYVHFDLLPQVLNPPGGYIHNENDSPHFTNMHGRIDTRNLYSGFEPPHLLLRSQLAIELIDGPHKVSLEDVVRLKHSYKMLLADRVKPDLIAAVKKTNPAGEIAAALALIEKWNNTAAPESRGAQLFEVWWQRYSQGLPEARRYSQPWDINRPTATPRGLADPARAAEAFAWAVNETAKQYGQWDVAWGDVHRVRRGSVDVPVGGCAGALGCFRTLTFTRQQDGKLAASGGDGWVLAVEFGDVPRAYSVLAYGQSPRPDSPWHADQAAMFAKGELKRVAFMRQDVDANVVKRYRPGSGK